MSSVDCAYMLNGMFDIYLLFLCVKQIITLKLYDSLFCREKEIKMAKVFSNGEETLVIEVDNYPCNPREDFDHIGHLLTWEGPRGYSSPDENDFSDPQEFVLEMLLEYYDFNSLSDALRESGIEIEYQTATEYPHLEYDFELHAKEGNKEETIDFWDEYREPDEEDLLQVLCEWVSYRRDALDYLSRKFALKKIYKFEHSCVSYSTRDFGDPWDSGCVGIAYATEDDARKFGLTQTGEALREQLLNDLDAEVEEYNKYVNNEVYCFTFYSKDKEVDACCGIYNDNISDKEFAKEILAEFVSDARLLEDIDNGTAIEDGEFWDGLSFDIEVFLEDNGFSF